MNLHCVDGRTLSPSGPATGFCALCFRLDHWDTSPARPELCGLQTQRPGTASSSSGTPQSDSPGGRAAVAAIQWRNFAHLFIQLV